MGDESFNFEANSSEDRESWIGAIGKAMMIKGPNLVM